MKGYVWHTPSRCLHREAGVCPSCLAFERTLRMAVIGVRGGDAAAWKPGVLASMSRASEGRR